MEKVQRDIIVAIIIATLTILIIVVFALLFFFMSIKKRRALEREKDMMEAQFAQTLLQSQVEIQEQTLRNISHEIHDNIGQILSLVSLNLHVLDSVEKEKLSATIGLVEKAINDLRTLAKILNPERVLKVGLKEALELELQYLEKSGKFSTSILVDTQFVEPEADRTIIIYRMCQEVLNNIIKHSEASAVFVELRRLGDQTNIIFRDNGKGFDIDRSAMNGLGLQNLHKRGSMINTDVTIESRPAKGTLITFTLN
jgi:signal transduction histidine kinase